MNPVDKARVRAAFSRGAAAYDGRAEVQAAVRAQALALAARAAPSARRVLDVGCGTGRLLADLAAARPGALLTGVDLAPGMCAAARAAAPGAALASADAEALPLRDAAFDLVLSTSTFQWLPRLEPALRECARVLRPGGRLVLALFAERTLGELTASWRAAAAGRAPDRTHRFFTRGEVGAALAAAGLVVAALEEEERVERHADARAVLRALKAIGAQNAAPQAGGLAGRRVTLELLRHYDSRYGGPDGVPVTWHVVYAVASR
ncbi:MAG: methyltransferase domain-containing protein [Anaeromyxobacter sp.]|nr:methyltransferase domain-containing protein [Anaeromyxobacter sp.]MBL0275687.1 methyltransferase domain-containing protein [Anaeromyxobacter sp.]